MKTSWRNLGQSEGQSWKNCRARSGFRALRISEASAGVKETERD